MNIEQFIADFKSENEAYDASNLIDELSLYKWVRDALKPLGMNIMQLQETVVSVKGKQTTLPKNFFSLYVAYKCNPKGYYTSETDKATLQSTQMWTERVERSTKWNSCAPCSTEEETKVITEKVYFGEASVDFYYDRPTLLKLGKNMKRNGRCHDKCRNLLVKDNPYEITIHGNTMFANFEEGEVYMQFYGLPTNEGGSIEIPDTGLGHVERYVEYYVHKKFFETLLKNRDDVNISQLFQYYVQQTDIEKGAALTETKFSKLTPKSYQRLKNRNRAEMYKYHFRLPV